LLKKPDVSDPDSPHRFLLRDSEHNTMHTFLFTVSRENFKTSVFFYLRMNTDV